MKKRKGGRTGRWRKGGREEGGREKYKIEPSDEGFNPL